MLDLAPLDGSDPAENHTTVERELELHDPALALRPRVLALSKADLVTPEHASERAQAWRARLGDAVPVFVTSSATGTGLEQLAGELLRSIPLEPAELAVESELVEHMTFRPGAQRGFRVERDGDGPFRVVGAGIDRLLARHDLDNDEALAHLETRLRQIGVVRALKEQGFEPGDDVEIAGILFDLDA
ncbi:MAG: Obg family GTPase CgtA [Solirubrobacteraceae bacterium]